MKKILAIILLMQFNALFAGTPPALVASPTVPSILDGSSPYVVENQTFNLWQFRLCGGNNFETDSIVSGNEILFFGHVSPGIPSPCPPHHYSLETQVNGLVAGTYNLSLYLVPSVDDFPPVVADYPLYLIEQSQFNVVPARIMVSPSTASSISTEILPTEGQAFRLWDFLPLLGCPGRESTEVNYVGNEINVFILLAPPSTTGLPCPSPLPPVYTPVADIQALEAGDYLIKYYIVPEGNAFPPIVADYPSYFIENRAFSVLQVSNVNSLSTLNLIALCTVFLLMGLFMVRNKI